MGFEKDADEIPLEGSKEKRGKAEID